MPKAWDQSDRGYKGKVFWSYFQIFIRESDLNLAQFDAYLIDFFFI